MKKRRGKVSFSAKDMKGMVGDLQVSDYEAYYVVEPSIEKQL